MGAERKAATSVRGDHVALSVAIRDAAVLCDITELHAPAAWPRNLFAVRSPSPESGIPELTVEQLELLSSEELENPIAQLARLRYGGRATSSRAS